MCHVICVSCADGNNGDGDDGSDRRDYVYRTQPVRAFSRDDRCRGRILLRGHLVYDPGSHSHIVIAMVTGLHIATDCA